MDSACDYSRNEYLIMELIVDYRKNYKAITVPDQKVVHRSWSFMQQPTIVWQLYVQWMDGSTLWQAIKDLKESHWVETSEYFADQEINNEPH